jgi:hypothetical protein
VLLYHTAQRKMMSIKKRFVSFTEGCSEGQRWSGRTQSIVSRSPEQLHHDRRQGSAAHILTEVVGENRTFL